MSFPPRALTWSFSLTSRASVSPSVEEVGTLCQGTPVSSLTGTDLVEDWTHRSREGPSESRPCGTDGLGAGDTGQMRQSALEELVAQKGGTRVTGSHGPCVIAPKDASLAGAVSVGHAGDPGVRHGPRGRRCTHSCLVSGPCPVKSEFGFLAPLAGPELCFHQGTFLQKLGERLASLGGFCPSFSVFYDPGQELHVGRQVPLPPCGWSQPHTCPAGSRALEASGLKLHLLLAALNLSSYSCT